MISTIQLVGVITSGLLLLLVLELVRRRKLTEEYSFFWIFCALALLCLSLWRDIIDTSAGWLGIFYPPIVLLLVLVFFVFVGLLYFSVVISTYRRRIEELIGRVAMLEARDRRVEERVGVVRSSTDNRAARSLESALPYEDPPRHP